MIMLLANPSLRCDPSLLKWLGHLAVPQNIGKVREPVWAADNGCFLKFDAELFSSMLVKCLRFHPPKFITAPDRIGDHAETLRLFKDWEPIVHGYGYPCAFVLQDGATPKEIPWDSFEALFVGGSTDFKLSNSTKIMVEIGKKLGKWIHMGRVNTAKRLRYAVDIGCDSCDGSGMAKFFDSTVPQLITWLQHNERQQKFTLQ